MPPADQHPYYDVNDDAACAAIDVLLAITWLHSHPPGAGDRIPDRP